MIKKRDVGAITTKCAAVNDASRSGGLETFGQVLTPDVTMGIVPMHRPTQDLGHPIESRSASNGRVGVSQVDHFERRGGNKSSNRYPSPRPSAHFIERSYFLEGTVKAGNPARIQPAAYAIARRWWSHFFEQQRLCVGLLV